MPTRARTGQFYFYMQLPLFKHCPKCNKTKFITEFPTKRKRKDGHDTYCKRCAYEYHSQWEHLPEVRDRIHERYKRKMSDPEKRKQENERLRDLKQTPEQRAKRSEYNKEYYQRPEVKARQKENISRWREQNSERHKENNKRWEQENPERVKELMSYHNRMRRAREYGCDGEITPEEWYSLCERYEFRCLCCGKEFPFDKLTHDHIVPVSMGGSHSVDNAQPLCRRCNSKKHDKTIDYRPKWE